MVFVPGLVVPHRSLTLPDRFVAFLVLEIQASLEAPLCLGGVAFFTSFKKLGTQASTGSMPDWWGSRRSFR
ncbi:hypothetical protein D3C78_1772960 [compost metagenome]